jgi:hypothetical protein
LMTCDLLKSTRPICLHHGALNNSCSMSTFPELYNMELQLPSENEQNFRCTFP